MARRKTTQELQDLSGLELEIMNIVWDLGECSSAEVIAACRDVRPLADTTVRTVLSNIRRKGYVKPIPTVERGYRLRPIVSREAVAKKSLKDLVANLFKNSPQDAIAYLIQDKNINDEELAEIRRLIDDHGSDKG